jgi:hypothetical protein
MPRLERVYSGKYISLTNTLGRRVCRISAKTGF